MVYKIMKTVFITGVGKGIGRAVAEKFLAEGWLVVGTTLNGQSDLTHENLKVFQLDLRDGQSIKNLTQAVSGLGSNLDVLINNAGVLLDEDDTRIEVDKLRETLEVNLLGTINLTEQLAGLVKPGGHIINISSSAGSLTLTTAGESHYPDHYPAYKISKAALNMYTVTLARALKSQGIIVSAVNPGWVKTDMGGAEAELTPAEAADKIFKFAISRPETGHFWYQSESLPW